MFFIFRKFVDFFFSKFFYQCRSANDFSFLKISGSKNSKFINAGDDEKVLKGLLEVKKFYDTYFTNVQVMASSPGPEEEDKESEPKAGKKLGIF